MARVWAESKAPTRMLQPSRIELLGLGAGDLGLRFGVGVDHLEGVAHLLHHRLADIDAALAELPGQGLEARAGQEAADLHRPALRPHDRGRGQHRARRQGADAKATSANCPGHGTLPAAFAATIPEPPPRGGEGDAKLHRMDARMYRQDLFPPLEPYTTGMLPLDRHHTMYWEQSGNPHGVPILFLHGGPGAGATPTHRRFFDPAHYRIVIFDQRGAGRSLPLGSLEGNALAHLVEDIEVLRRHLGIDALGRLRRLVGLDPGARLCRGASRALPRLVLRGIFLCRAARDRLVPLWHAHRLSRGVARVLGLPARGRARRHPRRLFPPPDRSRSVAPHAGGAGVEHL